MPFDLVISVYQSMKLRMFVFSCSCWTVFVLAGQCTQTSTTKCLKVGRDIDAKEAEKYKKGTWAH